MLLFSAFFVLLLVGVLMILWEFDHATQTHLKNPGLSSKPDSKGVVSSPASKAA